MKLRTFLNHPATVTTRRILRRIVAVTAVILAVAIVMTLSVDLGPSLRERAEREGTRYLSRGLHIGELSVRL